MGFLRLCTAGLVMTSMSGAASMPLTLWRGVDRIFVACADAPDARSAVDALCREVVREAGRGSPYPVALLAAGVRPTARDVVLRVTTALAPGGDRPALTFSVTADRSDPRSETDAPSRPRAAAASVPLDAGGAPGPLAEAVASQLDSVLPWRGPPRQPRSRRPT